MFSYTESSPTERRRLAKFRKQVDRVVRTIYGEATVAVSDNAVGEGDVSNRGRRVDPDDERARSSLDGAVAHHYLTHAHQPRTRFPVSS